jgi:hypothetical protein
MRLVMGKGAVVLPILMLTMSACSPMYLAARPPVDISGYRGNGVIVPLKHPINPGFKIDFESFPLNEPCAVAYRLDGLPRPRHHSPYEVSLAVELTPDEASLWPKVPSWLKANSLGTIAIRVKTPAGPLLLDIEGPVAGQYWSRLIDEDTLFAVIRVPNGSDSATSRFPSDRAREPDQRPNVLEVDYRPGEDSISRRANVRIVAGGED